MRPLSKPRLTRQFAQATGDTPKVTPRRRVLGALKHFKPLDYLQRLKTYCKGPLPFTGAKLLKEGKKR